MDAERIVWLISLVAAGAAGLAIGTYRGEVKLNDLRLDAAVLRAEQGKAAYARLVAAQDALAASRAGADALRGDAERLRQSYERRLQRASDAACGDERAAVARCEGLLREGADLLEEGGTLLRRNAAVHDAVTANFGHN